MGPTGFAVVVAGAAALSAVAGDARAEMYVVEVRHIDQGLYKTSEGVYIQTRYCYRYAYGEEAVLKYEQYSYDNKLIFDDGEVCEVKKVFK